MRLQKFIEKLEIERKIFVEEFNKEPSIQDFSDDWSDNKLTIGLYVSRKIEGCATTFNGTKEIVIKY